jgi:hypothetical protein
MAEIKTAAASTGSDAGPSSAVDSRAQQIDYFAVQSDAVADKQLHSELNAIELQRSLFEFDNPRDAGRAAEILDAATGALHAQLETARMLQVAESMKGWIHYVSHSSLGSVAADEAPRKGLKQTKDGTATAQIDHAHATRAYDGVIELEFEADANHPGKAVHVASARLFGVANAAVESLGLDKKSLRTAGLPIRARSTSASSPVHVSIARDEAGNVRFSDDSGAPGMPSPWLGRRGGQGRSESAAQRAAKNLIEDLAGNTLTQLGVTLETDGTDV